jgi:hypothetical protein
MSDLVDKTNGSPIDTANSKYRESEYQCRLPPELMTKIFEILAHDKSLGTLAELQFTSSAIYSIRDSVSLSTYYRQSGSDVDAFQPV